MWKKFTKTEVEEILKRKGAFLRVNHIDGWDCKVFVEEEECAIGSIERSVFNQLNLKRIGGTNRDMLSGMLGRALGMSISLSDEDYALR